MFMVGIWKRERAVARVRGRVMMGMRERMVGFSTWVRGGENMKLVTGRERSVETEDQ